MRASFSIMNLPDKSGVPAGAAGDDLHLLEDGEFGRRDLHLIEEDAAGLLRRRAPAWYRGRRAAARKSP